MTLARSISNTDANHTPSQSWEGRASGRWEQEARDLRRKDSRRANFRWTQSRRHRAQRFRFDGRPQAHLAQAEQRRRASQEHVMRALKLQAKLVKRAAKDREKSVKKTQKAKAKRARA